MTRRVVVLTGGVGGAKLVDGLARILPPTDLVAIVNTGDDFSYLGLHVSPDIDTLLCTLSGKADCERGWGREGESWAFMDALRELGGEDWFALGDGDLAVHVLRTAAIAAGARLGALTAGQAPAWGVGCTVLPMSDDPVATHLFTDCGELPFQDYFVRLRCAPIVNRIEFHGAERAMPAPGVLEAIAAADRILVAPSNPYLSVDPILAVPGIADAVRRSPAPVVAVSPIVGGAAVKGPTAKLMVELGVSIGNDAIATHYGSLLDGMLIDASDAPADALPTARTHKLMRSSDDRIRVAAAALALAHTLRS